MPDERATLMKSFEEGLLCWNGRNKRGRDAMSGLRT
jgi:hypothetical protein